MSGGHSSAQMTVAPKIPLDVRELARFLAWLERAAQANQRGGPLPDPPTFHDRTVTRWSHMIMELAGCTGHVEARLRGAEHAVEEQAGQLRDQTLRVAEQLAALYELSGRPCDAQTVRLRAAGLSLRA